MLRTTFLQAWHFASSDQAVQLETKPRILYLGKSKRHCCLGTARVTDCLGRWSPGSSRLSRSVSCPDLSRAAGTAWPLFLCIYSPSTPPALPTQQLLWLSVGPTCSCANPAGYQTLYRRVNISHPAPEAQELPGLLQEHEGRQTGQCLGNTDGLLVPGCLPSSILGHSPG